MPIYDFTCIQCKHKFEEFLHSHRKPNPDCKICGSATERDQFYNTLIDMDGIVTSKEGKKRELWTKGSKIV